VVNGELPSAPTGLAAGSQIAGYVIEEQVGRGGMAVVYRAFDPRLNRSVALKILAPELAGDAAFRQRFMREMRAAASVDHPHIVPVFDAGEADGVLYIAMRYVRGQDLRTLLDSEHTLPPARVAYLIAQVASALDDAHARGLIHRDVKPGNMLIGSVTGSGQPDHVYLSDFGLSKPALSSANLTLTGQFLGTLDYMAPEQVEGHAVDGRADLYSLGCTAFEMLAGEPPFKRDQGFATAWAQLSAPAPSLRARRPDLPPAVDQVIARALAKAPADRYRTCSEFADALRAACGVGRPGATPPAPPPAPPGPPTERAHIGRQPPPPSPPTERAHVQPPFGQPGPDIQTSPQPRPAASWQPTPQRSQQPAAWPPAPPPTRQPPTRQPPNRQPTRRPPDRRPPGPPAQRSRKAAWAGAAVAFIVIIAVAAVVGLLLRKHNGPPTGGKPTAAASGATTPAAALGPAATVRAYYAAINAHDYPRAWALIGGNSSQTADYNAFVQGFDQTKSDNVTIVSVAGHVVTVRLAATQANGSVKNYQGTYTVTNGVITQSHIQAG
jgi:serine/threonine protein kinase